jgi:serine/threonine-protein kinase
MSEWPPTGAEPSSASALDRVDRLCDEFEDAWQKGLRPRIEDFLADASGDERDELLRWLIPLDVTYRRRHEETPEIRDYLELSPTLSVDWLAGVVRPGMLLAERYLFGEKIGVGGIAEVHRGQDRCLDRPVAAKVLLEKYQHHADMVRRFQNEARITSRLQHPGIVPVHDLGLSADGRPCFTMKLVQGRTLAALLTERTDPTRDLPRFLTVFEHIGQTLAYAHAQGVIHRDLKPENVMVGAFGEVQVMDWGLAKVLVRTGDNEAAAAPAGGPTTAPSSEETVESGFATLEGQAMGTLAYMPPEQARGELKRVDERSDVFGLGAILCKILTGQPPFTGKDNLEVWAKARTCDHAEALSRLDGCGADARLVSLAKACLAAEPDDRPRNAGAVAEEVKAYQAGVQERLRAAERERSAAQARAKEARKTLAATAGVLLALMLLASTIGYFLHERQTRQTEAEANQRVEADRQRQAIGTALDKVTVLRQQGHGAEARVVLEQARDRLGDTGPTDLRWRLEQASADLDLVGRLEAIRLRRETFSAIIRSHRTRDIVIERFRRADDPAARFRRADDPAAAQDYAMTLREAGVGEAGEDTEVVAARIRDSAVCEQLVAALDDWAYLQSDPQQRAWLLEVARRADPDPWRDRFRDRIVWRDPTALTTLAGELLCDKTQLAKQKPLLLVALGHALEACKANSGRYRSRFCR